VKRFVFAADTHLSEWIWRSAPEIYGDAFESFRQIVDHTLSIRAEALVLGGDVFDGVPSSVSMRFWLSETERLAKAGIKVLGVQGQHGRTMNGVSWHAVHPNCTDIDGLTTEIFPEVFLLALNRLPAVELEETLRDIPFNLLRSRTKILVLHQLVKGAVPDVEGLKNWDLDPEWIPDSIPLVLLGDLHEPYSVQRGVSKLIYSGSTHLRSISEPDDKSFLVVSEDLSVERVPLRTREFRRPAIFSDDQLAAAIADLETAKRGAVAYAKYDPAVKNAYEALKSACAERGLFLLARTIAQSRVSSAGTEVSDDADLESCLGLEIDREKDPNAFSFGLELLLAAKPADAIDKFRARFTGG